MNSQCKKSFAAWALCWWLAASGVARGEWQNSLKPTGTPAGDIALVMNGKSVRPIRIAKNATTIENTAAKELQYWIEQTTTTRPDIVTTGAGPGVRLQTDAKLGEEGYRIAIEGDDLVLVGGTGRGVINAVYALLEEDLGCRFYTPDSIKLPKGMTLSVRPVARSFVPRLRLRDPLYHAALDPAWSLRNRTNAPHSAVGEEAGGRIDYDGLFVHTHAKLLPAKKYFQEHPEYFSLKSTGERDARQLCATHPEVAKIVSQAVLDTLATNPHTEIVSVSKNDNGGDQICHCERCRKIRDAEGSDVGCQLVLVNAVADAVAKAYPHVVVDTLAYHETAKPPKHIRPRPNVVIRLCNDFAGAMNHPFTPAAQCEVAQLIAAWSSFQKRIYIWDYNVNFAHYLAPMPNIDVMADNIRFWVKNNAEGVMLQGGNVGPAEADEMKSWVTSKLLWDPSRDENALVQDFISGHYGPAAPALAEYETLLYGLRKTHAAEMESPKGGIYYKMDVPFYTKDFIDKATSIFARAKQMAASDEPLLRRVERAELPILYVKCSRGPNFAGPNYGNDVAEFERISRRAGVAVLSEGRDNYDAVLAVWKERIPKSLPR